MKQTTDEDGTTTATFTFVDHYIYGLKGARDLINEAIERLEHIDRDVRPDGSLAARAYVAFNAEQAAGAMHGALRVLTDVAIDFAGARALLSPKPASETHAVAERTHLLVEEAQRHERGEPDDTRDLREQLVAALKASGPLRLPALVKAVGDAYLKSHPLRNPADGGIRDGAHQFLMKRAKRLVLDLINEGALILDNDYTLNVRADATRHPRSKSKR